MASSLHPDRGTDVAPHHPIRDPQVPWACAACPLPVKNTRVHLDWESAEAADDITAPRSPAPPPAQLPLP